jgi:hypothetical protein
MDYLGKGKFNGDGEVLSSDEEAEMPVPTLWTEWKGLGGAILTLSSTNGGGDEFNDAILIRCK